MSSHERNYEFDQVEVEKAVEVVEELQDLDRFKFIVMKRPDRLPSGKPRGGILSDGFVYSARVSSKDLDESKKVLKNVPIKYLDLLEALIYERFEPKKELFRGGQMRRLYVRRDEKINKVDIEVMGQSDE